MLAGASNAHQVHLRIECTMQQHSIHHTIECNRQHRQRRSPEPQLQDIQNINRTQRVLYEVSKNVMNRQQKHARPFRSSEQTITF